MRVCEICGATSEETRIYNSKKVGKILCRKHYLQMLRHGKVYNRTIYDPNEIHTNEEYSEIVLYGKNCEEIGCSKIDTVIIPAIKDRKWYLRPNGYTFGAIPNSGTKMKLHDFVYEYFTGDKITKGYEIDHINGDRSDNRLENLRKCTHQENMFNIHKEYKTVGVSYHKRNGVYKWVALIMINGKSIWLGAYDSEEEATKVRKEAEKKYFNK